MGKPSIGLLMDIRGLDPSLRRGLVLSVVDKLVEQGCTEQILIVCEHEPVGLGYQIDLRRETRGRFEIFCDQRSDGAWVAVLKPRPKADADRY